jgi:dTDP-4-dehydrorhamnose 3,5-epimerase
MKFSTTRLQGVVIVTMEVRRDQRGFFARTWCRDEFDQAGLNPVLVQCNISWNRKKGTVRGMHFQEAPWAEAKVVRCTRGAIHDVVVDIRPGSLDFGRSIGVRLTDENRRMLYIPTGFAHGFQTLQDDTEVLYQMSQFFHPECSRGIRWNDPAIQVRWPLEISCISPRDRDYRDFRR